MKFFLYYPVKPLITTQKFGETAYLAYYATNGIQFNGHNGMDMAAAHGTPVYAAHDGIAYPEVDEKQGHGVVVISNEKFDYKDGQAYFKSIYWHFIDNIPVKFGQEVKAGDLLGYADSTGLSTGDHLHFGLKPMSEKTYLEGFNIEANNGYYGAIDPGFYFNGQYAEDIHKHLFLIDMAYGMRSNEVTELQKTLKKHGFFPAAQECTGYYGDVTRKAVYNFQQANIVMSWFESAILKGSKVGPKTREALNGLS